MKLNIPNSLTLFRIFLVPFLVVVLLTKFEGREIVALAIFLIATATDFFDGWLARRRGEITTLGTLLDPIADKLLISAAFISLVEVGLVPAWMVVVVVGREFAVTGLRSIASGQGIVISASGWGKAKMTSQITAISHLGSRCQPGMWADFAQLPAPRTPILSLRVAMRARPSLDHRTAGRPD